MGGSIGGPSRCPALNSTPPKPHPIVLPAGFQGGAKRLLPRQLGSSPVPLLFPLANSIWRLLANSPVPLCHNQFFVCGFRLGIYMHLGTFSHFPKSYCVLKKKNLRSL